MKLTRAGKDRVRGRKGEEVPEEDPPEVEFEGMFPFVRKLKMGEECQVGASV